MLISSLITLKAAKCQEGRAKNFDKMSISFNTYACFTKVNACNREVIALKDVGTKELCNILPQSSMSFMKCVNSETPSIQSDWQRTES